ncbi:MAG: peptide transporter permease, partial [Mycobacterium sp.]|nr:peptide transporter permease [Mycobacterium sp.]
MATPTEAVEAPGDPVLPVGVPAAQIRGRSPWYLAWLRLRRNKVALAFGVLFILIVLFCLAAPLWADHVAHTGPNENHITDKVMIDGQEADVVSPDGTPIGPGLHGRYLLGADQNGRDVMVRLMYGGRTSIYIGVIAAALTTILAVLVGLVCGYYRGWIDALLSRVMDVVWAFPVLLLGIALGTALALGGIKIGDFQVAGDSLWIPILIIGLVYVPYMARPIRGEILALREKEFVEAAVAQGKGPVRIMVTEL